MTQASDLMARYRQPYAAVRHVNKRKGVSIRFENGATSESVRLKNLVSTGLAGLLPRLVEIQTASRRKTTPFPLRFLCDCSSVLRPGPIGDRDQPFGFGTVLFTARYCGRSCKAHSEALKFLQG
jgi:hypothetical protein